MSFTWKLEYLCYKYYPDDVYRKIGQKTTDSLKMTRNNIESEGQIPRQENICTCGEINCKIFGAISKMAKDFPTKLCKHLNVV